jgi:hypothetical protein
VQVRWIVAGLAALAAFALALTGATYSAPTQSVDVGGNQLRAGVLRLDLSGGDARARLAFPGLMPGGRSATRMWLAANDASSPVAATLAVRFDRLRDVGADGGPGQLSERLQFDLAVSGGSDCHGAPGTPVALPATGPGNLRALAAGTGTRVVLRQPDGTPVVLAPGAGVCLAVTAYWPPTASDNDAQGDSFSVRAVVELTQAGS